MCASNGAQTAEHPQGRPKTDGSMQQMNNGQNVITTGKSSTQDSVDQEPRAVSSGVGR